MREPPHPATTGRTRVPRATRASVPPGWAVLLCCLLVMTGLAVVTPTAAYAASDPCGPNGNEISCENSLPGTPQTVWDVEGSGDASIQGFASEISVEAGDPIDFKVDTDASAYVVTIYRTGYYDGDGARRIATLTPSAALPQQQPQCISDVATELFDCGNWAVSVTWDVPSTAVSGIYLARLSRPDNGDASLITFIVRDDASHSDVVFQTSDPTWQAYNDYGGSNFYRGGDAGRARKVSYNRPMLTRDGPGGRDFYFSNEYPLVRFLERNGYDVSYIAGVDTDRAGALLRNHRVFLSVGHDEYWSAAQRANVEAARDAGVHLQFLSGNEVYWKTRYEPSAAPGNAPYRTLVSYKETWDNTKSDPSSEWTGTWRDPRFAPTSAGAGRPENGLTGTAYMVNYSDFPVTVSQAEGKYRLWRNTPLASMSGGPAQLAPHTVGYESNEDLDNGARPPGLIRMSTTSGAVDQYLQDFGTRVAAGSTNHHLTLYRAESGALVFSAGSVQWTWGLDEIHDSPFAPEPADRRMQQAQVNLFADMGAQPTTLETGLVAATASQDTVGPTVTIDSPAQGASPANGWEVEVTGTAVDAEGRVAGVEVSTDGGDSWHPAIGTSSWSYTYLQRGQGETSLRVRAVDDSANIGPARTRDLLVRCPCSIFGSTVPATPAANDSYGAELGVRFTPTKDGFVSGVRFFRGQGNDGTHVGSLWSSDGTRLATAQFVDKTSTGWQSVSFTSAVPVVAGVTYVASYTAPQGRYAVQPEAFAASGVDDPPLTVAGGFGATPAGVYADPGRFPQSSFQRANYFVDVLFTTTDTSPLVITDRWPLPGSTSVPTTTSVTGRLSRPPADGDVAVRVEDASGEVVAGSTGYDAESRVVTFTPASPLEAAVRHTVQLTALDQQGNPIAEGGSWSFTTARPAGEPGVCPCSLFEDASHPTVLDFADPTAVTLGVRFSSTVGGTVTGVRFYKGPANTGSHTGTLWSASGEKLAEGVFADESSAGWQTLVFADPVTIVPGTDYVASYRTQVGRYAATPNGFGNQNLSRPPLAVSSTAGAYSYADGFPGNRSATDYGVDLVFERAAPEISVVTQSPAPGALEIPRAAPVVVTFSAPVRPGATLEVSPDTADGSALPGSMQLSSDATRLTFTPTGLLPADQELRVRLTGVTSVDGATLPAQSWGFRTRGPDPNAQSLFSDHLPQVSSAADAAPVELGTVFGPTRDGTITALRFFKGTGNLGTHTGSLWTETGTRLATVTFASETATGWQTAELSSPVPVTAGSRYVVSYHAPQGHYSVTPGFFSTPFTSGDLTAPSGGNGRYLYGSGGFPQSSYGAANYFVDVVFEPTPSSIDVVERSPAAGSTGISRAVSPSITLSADVAAGYTMTLSRAGAQVDGSVTLSDNRRRLRFTPVGLLPPDTPMTVTASGITSTDGASLPDQSWTFRTESAGPEGSSLFGQSTPDVASANDSGAVELGTKFTPTLDGSVTQLRFYKGIGNTGQHVGSLWTASGTLLGRVTFEDETATGWQVATLTSPVPVTAGSTYVASYFAPAGHYAATFSFFTQAYTSGPLTAPSGDNGVYVYASGGGFPTRSWGSTNYYVDVTFRPGS